MYSHDGRYKTRWLLFAIILFFLFVRAADTFTEIKANLNIIMLSSILSNFREDVIWVQDEKFTQVESLINDSSILYASQTVSRAIGLTEYIRNKPEEALYIWQQAEISPAYALKLRADYANANSQLDEALAFYMSSVQYDPSIPEVWHEIGNIRDLQGNNTSAIDAYEKAWSLNNFLSVEPLGSLYNEIGEFGEAAKLWEQALFEYPNYSGRVIWWRNLLFSMRSANLLEELLPTANAAISEYPNDAQLYIELGFALQNSSRPLDEAADAFGEAIRLNEELPAAYAAMGNLMAQNQKFDDAFYWYSEAIKRMPENENLYILRANMSRASGNFEQALTLYETASRQFPQNSRIWYEIAWTYRQTEQKAEAIESLNQALNLDSSPSSDFLLRAGLIFEWAQEEDRAVLAYQKVLLIEPENEVALARLDSLQP